MLPFRIEHLQYHIKEKYVSVQKHPEAELYIYNYTQKAQFDNVWNNVTTNCRGLILDKDYNIVARPFKKFFNYSELQDNPNKGIIPRRASHILFDKMDGSLGIIYPLNGKFYVATRGSFISEQAMVATDMLHNKYGWKDVSTVTKSLIHNKTILLEIIYPENKIVVNYGDESKLVQLAIIDNETGDYYGNHFFGFPVVQNYPEYSNIPFDELSKMNLENKEGFVVFYPESNFRMKVKFEEYVRLHRIVTNVSTRTIWQYLRDGESIDEMIQNVPDEFYDWVKSKVSQLTLHFAEVTRDCHDAYKDIYSGVADIVDDVERKKSFALKVQTVLDKKCWSVLFRMYDKRDYRELVWKIVEPKFEKPFKQVMDDSN